MTRWFPDAMPEPMADTDSLGWWEAAAQHRLVVQRCGDCSRMRLPPAPICPSCRSDSAQWHEVSGRGEIYTYTVVHRPVAADQDLPFVIAVIDLDGADGVRMISNVVECALGDVRIGMTVEVVWEDMSADLAIPRFRPS